MQQTFKYLFKSKILHEQNSQEVIPNKQELAEQEEYWRKKEQEAFDEGYEKALGEVKAQQKEIKENKHESDLYLEVLNNVHNQIEQIVQQHKENDQKYRVDLVMLIAEKLANTTIDSKYYEVVTDFINSFVSEIEQNLPIIVKVNNDLVAKLQQDFDSEKIKIVGNNELSKADCIIEWKNGKAENIFKNRKEKINLILRGEGCE